MNHLTKACRCDIFLENMSLYNGNAFIHSFQLHYSRIYSSHPEVKGPKGKEPHFFDMTFEKGLDYYKSLMSKSYPHQLTFEKVRFCLLLKLA